MKYKRALVNRLRKSDNQLFIYLLDKGEIYLIQKVSSHVKEDTTRHSDEA